MLQKGKRKDGTGLKSFYNSLRPYKETNEWRNIPFQVSGGVTERSRLLSQIADELESVKAEMEERGSSMTDGAPLVNIRKTLGRMKQEVKQSGCPQ